LFFGLMAHAYFALGKTDVVFPLLVSIIAIVPLQFLLSARIKANVHSQINSLYKLINKSSLTNNDLGDNDRLASLSSDVEGWVTEKQAEIESLKETEEYRKEFLGNVSHELKTPIFNIQGYVETLLDGGIDDPKVNLKFLTLARNSVDRMINLVNDLEAISRLEFIQLKEESFDIVELIKEVYQSLEIKAESRNILLGFKAFYPKSINVIGDKELIRRVITNLVVNSIKYGREDGNTLVSFSDVGEVILIEVQDDGVGIASEHILRLFERFYRVEESRSRDAGGTGLGLAIVKHIVEAHGETINVRSKEGDGSTFGFTIKKGS
jgi:two-component system phosphate regulon sensor histidine kinase PhoR